jgi:heat shock protein 5
LGAEDLDVPLSRALFEELCQDLFDRLIPPLESALNDSRWKKSDLDQILLVGGSTRMPKVKEIVKNFFGKEPSQDLKADEAVAMGAAIQGAVLSGEEGDVVLCDVNPLSLGVGLRSGRMSVLIQRNRNIPTKAVKHYTTSRDNQIDISFKLYEGEFPMAAGNHFLGEFNVSGIQKAKRGNANIEVTMEIDANGIVTLTAVDLDNKKNRRTLTVTPKDHRLPEAEVEDAINRAKQAAKEEAARSEAKRLRDAIRQYLTSVQNGITDGEIPMSETDRGKAMGIIKRHLNWLDDLENPDDPAQFSAKLSNIVGELEPFVGDFAVPDEEEEEDAL